MYNFIKKYLSKKKTENNSIEECGVPAIIYALEAETEKNLCNYKNALSLITKAIEKEPNNDMYYITQALIFKAMKNYYLAIESVNKAIELNGSVKSSQDLKKELEQLTKE